MVPAQSLGGQRTSPLPRAWHPPGRRPLLPPRCSAGLRQCSAAIFWPRAALHPRPPYGVKAAAAQGHRAPAASAPAEPAPTRASPLRSPAGRSLSFRSPDQPRPPQRGRLPLESDSAPRTQEAQRSLRLPLSPPTPCLGVRGPRSKDKVGEGEKSISRDLSGTPEAPGGLSLGGGIVGNQCVCFRYSGYLFVLLCLLFFLYA